MSTKILYVEDDKLFGETITEFLEDEGFEVSHHLDASTALDATFTTKFDLYLLDINLPTQNGIEFYKQLHQSDDKTPAIFLTSSSQSQDLKDAFSAGCEDFLTKPVDLDELLLRIRALLRRVYGEDKLSFGDYILDRANHTLMHHEEPIILKPKTFLLLHLLVSNAGNIVTMDTIEERLWERNKQPSSSAIRVYFSEIKHAIGPDYITNIRGVGYQFNVN